MLIACGFLVLTAHMCLVLKLANIYSTYACMAPCTDSASCFVPQITHCTDCTHVQVNKCTLAKVTVTILKLLTVTINKTPSNQPTCKLDNQANTTKPTNSSCASNQPVPHAVMPCHPLHKPATITHQTLRPPAPPPSLLCMQQYHADCAVHAVPYVCSVCLRSICCSYCTYNMQHLVQFVYDSMLGYGSHTTPHTNPMHV
jgi:hypothetical protein